MTHIVLATNESYVGPTAVAIRSAIDHFSPDNNYQISVLHTGLNSESVKKIEAQSVKNARIQCVNISDLTKDVQELNSGHLTAETLYRLYIPEIFKDEEKVVYIDGDVIVCDDLALLYDVDVENYVMAAAQDVPSAENLRHYTTFMEPDPDRIFNAGILVMNLRKFTDRNVKQRCLDRLLEDARSKERKLTYMDQDALNLTCQGEVKTIDMAWNTQPLFRHRGMEDTIITEAYRETYRKAMNEYKAIHYTGTRKPWMYPGILYGEKFWEVEKKVNFHEEIGAIRNRTIKELSGRYPFWNIRYGSRVAIYGAGYQGERLKKELEESAYAQVACVIDSRKCDADGEVVSPEEAMRISCDQILLAVENEGAAVEIYNKLLRLGTPKEKIEWLFHRNRPWK